MSALSGMGLSRYSPRPVCSDGLRLMRVPCLRPEQQCLLCAVLPQQRENHRNQFLVGQNAFHARPPPFLALLYPVLKETSRETEPHRLTRPFPDAIMNPYSISDGVPFTVSCLQSVKELALFGTFLFPVSLPKGWK